jgi:exonuclease SbcC
MLARINEANILENEIRVSEATVKKERAVWQNKLGIKQNELEDAEQAAKELLSDENKLAELNVLLNKREYLPAEQNELKKILMELAEIGYDSREHEHLKQQISGLLRFEKLREELNRAESLITAETNSLKETDELISNSHKMLTDNQEKASVLSLEIEKQNYVTEQLKNEENEYKIIQQKETELRDNLAANQERLRYLSELENSIQDNENKSDLLRKEENIFQELSEAFGKKGIQALLIKQAFPEIETEANRLLNRMTDNRLSLTLESQKEMKSKKGEVMETLDIKISDELGTRNYEMFSGGESFRIDLALRIALSKLLVRRAGASMPLLIIDEGFGTQDVTGREKLIEAIKSIEDDFEKIFVITHLEELKEYFPVIISINKTINGSTISVN